MPTLSKRSLDHLATCHPDLQKVAHECIKHFDFTVIEGHRGQVAQDKAFKEGKSKVKWPNGKHNAKPSRAMDCTPVPLNWNDKASFGAMAKAMKAAAHKVNVKIVWGGDWKSFYDGPHFELA